MTKMAGAIVFLCAFSENKRVIHLIGQGGGGSLVEGWGWQGPIGTELPGRGPGGLIPEGTGHLAGGVLFNFLIGQGIPLVGPELDYPIGRLVWTILSGQLGPLVPKERLN